MPADSQLGLVVGHRLEQWPDRGQIVPSRDVVWSVSSSGSRTRGKQARIDAGEASGTTSDDAQRIAEMEKQNRELRRANTILRQASACFAQEELDRHRAVDKGREAAEAVLATISTLDSVGP